MATGKGQAPPRDFDARRCWKAPDLVHVRDSFGFCAWCGAGLDTTGCARDSQDPAQLDILGGDAA